MKVIKPGTSREMLLHKSDFTVAESKWFLHTHIGDKSSTELLQELSNAKLQGKGSPQQFLHNKRVLSSVFCLSHNSLVQSLDMTESLLKAPFSTRFTKG